MTPIALEGPRMNALEVRQRIRDLIKQLADDNSGAVGELTGIAQSYPKAYSRELSDHLAHLTRIAFVDKLSGDRDKQNQYLAQMAVIAAELAGDDP